MNFCFTLVLELQKPPRVEFALLKVSKEGCRTYLSFLLITALNELLNNAQAAATAAREKRQANVEREAGENILHVLPRERERALPDMTTLTRPGMQRVPPMPHGTPRIISYALELWFIRVATWDGGVCLAMQWRRHGPLSLSL